MTDHREAAQEAAREEVEVAAVVPLTKMAVTEIDATVVNGAIGANRNRDPFFK